MRAGTTTANPEGIKHLVIGDTQQEYQAPTKHFLWMARYAVDKGVNKVVHVGDFGEYSGLSAWDSAVKRAFEQRAVGRDFDAVNKALEVFEEELYRLGWKGEKHITFGNHEYRIDRFLADHPELRDLVSYDRLNFKKYGWRTYPFLEVATVDGIAYSHFFPRNHAGKVFQQKHGAPSALAQVRREMRSCTAGHTPGLDTAIYTAGDRMLRGAIIGSSYLHEPEYHNAQGRAYWRGVLLKHNVRDGNYNLCEVPLDYLEKKYGR